MRKGVILTAGYGTRFLPATKAVPKAMLPIADKPAVQYLVEEAVAAGLSQIVMVVSPAAADLLRQHFSPAPALEAFLAERGNQAQLAEVRRIAELAEITYVCQEEPLGIAHALLCAQPAVGDEPFVLFFTDDIVVNCVPLAGQLAEVFQRHGGPVVAVMRVPREDISSYGVVAVEAVGERLFRVLGLVEKPEPQEAPSDLAIVGRYLLTPDIFAAALETPPGRDGEVQLTDALAILSQRRPLFAYQFQGNRYDTGRPLGMLLATLDMALRRPDLAAGLREYLSQKSLTGGPQP